MCRIDVGKGSISFVALFLSVSSCARKRTGGGGGVSAPPPQQGSGYMRRYAKLHIPCSHGFSSYCDVCLGTCFATSQWRLKGANTILVEGGTLCKKREHTEQSKNTPRSSWVRASPSSRVPYALRGVGVIGVTSATDRRLWASLCLSFWSIDRWPAAQRRAWVRSACPAVQRANRGQIRSSLIRRQRSHSM